MAKKKTKPTDDPTPETPPAIEGVDPMLAGLFQFYSSQAAQILPQYQNINQLLGVPTNDWTAPGTHCELLIRNFLRRNVLSWMSVDKGFVHGVVSRDGKLIHGTEIDILVHNTRDFAPIFRLEDFVIVQPKAVIGIIQVKRTLSGRGNPLMKGIKQVMAAKQHLLDVLVERRPGKRIEIEDVVFPRFSAVIGFEADEKLSIKDCLEKCYSQHKAKNYYLDAPANVSASLLPELIGSLTTSVAYVGNAREQNRRQYFQAPTNMAGGNISLQALLLMFRENNAELWPTAPIFSFPKMQHSLTQTYSIPPRDEKGEMHFNLV